MSETKKKKRLSVYDHDQIMTILLLLDFHDKI
jgi:hypothetical protein